MQQGGNKLGFLQDAYRFRHSHGGTGAQADRVCTPSVPVVRYQAWVVRAGQAQTWRKVVAFATNPGTGVQVVTVSS
jgi:hypothetical protein